jgi:hypothetical protein
MVQLDRTDSFSIRVVEKELNLALTLDLYSCQSVGIIEGG